MPCYNHAQFVAESVKGVLNQSEQDIELIIVDDCSTDNSWYLIEGLANKDARVRPIKHPKNLGASKSRNDGLRAASGKFIGFCDADDVWESDKLRVQIELLETSSGYGATYCDSIIIDGAGAQTGARYSELFPPPKKASGMLFNELLGRNFINMQSVLMRRECLQDVGYFDEKIKWVEDWWYWIRVSRNHSFVYLPQVLGKYRVHSNSTNVMQRYGYSVNRFKVFHRILDEFDDLTEIVKAKIICHIGVELHSIGKHRFGHRFLWSCAQVAFKSRGASVQLGKSLFHLMVNPPRKSTFPYQPKIAALPVV